MDTELGAAFDAAKDVLGENTFFLHTSDHGAQWPFAKWSCYDGGILTPMFAVWPHKIAGGGRTHAMVSWIDILPTLVEVAGGHAPSGIDGRSFHGVLLQPSRSHRDRIFTTHTNDGRMNIYPTRSVRTADWKYLRNLHPEYYFSTHVDIVQGNDAGPYFASWVEKAKADPTAAFLVQRYHERPGEELYNLQSDPLELKNLAADPFHRERLVTLRAEVTAWMLSQGDQGAVPVAPRLLSDPARAEPPAPSAVKKTSNKR